MKSILLAVTNFINDEEGASAVEYGILVAAIAAVIVGVTVILGGKIQDAFVGVCEALSGVSGVNTTACR